MASLGPAASCRAGPSVVQGHLTLLYRSRAGQFDAAAPFLGGSLEADGHLLYLLDDASERQVTAALRQIGVDVESAVDDDRLRFCEAAAAVPEDGSVQPDTLTEAVERTVGGPAEAPDDLRIALEVTGDRVPDPSAVTRIQRAVGRAATRYGAALAQFDRSSLGDDAARRAIRTAPRLVPAPAPR